MNALTLLVDAANAESESTVKTAAVEDTKNGQKQKMPTKINHEEKSSPATSTAESTAAMALAASAGNQSPGLPGGAVVVPGGANPIAAALAARENAIFQQIQQQQGEAVKNRYLQELRQREQEQLSKERLAASAIMLQHEKKQQLLRLMGTGAPVGAASPVAPPPKMTPHQEAEYLQQLRLEALVQQRRQETLAQLALTQEMGYPNASTPAVANAPGAPAAVPKNEISKDAANKYKRQETALQKAILMARADEELRKQQLEHQQQVQDQRELEQHREQQKAAMLQLMSSEENSNSALLNALRIAAAAGSSADESAIMQVLEEREQQRVMGQNPHTQRPYLSPTAPSLAAPGSQMQLELQNQLQHHLQAQQLHGTGPGERADLIGSVFAKVAAASANGSSHHQGFNGSPEPSAEAPLPSRVLSAIAAVEQQEKQNLLQLQQHHQSSQGSFQSSGMMMDVLSHSQQQRQRLQQQAMAHHQQQQQQQQQQAAALAHQQQDSVQQQQQPAVERDASVHDSKSTILPCRARGMPMDHNVKTAYFVIPQNIKHGTELLCSYFACRNAGIKFRYCVYCKLPVAKRNFAKRHRHSGKIPNNEGSDDAVRGNAAESSADDEPRCTLATPQQIQEPRTHEKEASGDSKADKPTEVETPTGPPETVADSNDSSEKAVSQSSGDEGETPLANPETKSAKEIHVLDTKGVEPESGKSKDASPTREPSPVGITPEAPIDTSKRRAAWGDLLLKRPKTQQHNSEAMTAWIRDVLRVSDFETDVESNDDESKSDIQRGATSPTLNGGTKRKMEETRPPSAKKSKKRALLSRKEQEDMDNNTESDKAQEVDEKMASEDVSNKVSGKTYEVFPDDASTSSDESVDLRARKKHKN